VYYRGHTIANETSPQTDEALVNIYHHAYPDADGEVMLTCTVNTQQRCIMEIVDHGVPFDMLSRPEPDLTSDLAHRQGGGLGVFLIRKVMDEVTYRQESGQNILRLVVYSPQEPQGGA
jgi:anti-sigma regulatory factor (Ser/Thr protein kinase)